MCPRQGWLIEFSLAWYCLTCLVWSVSQIICAICVLKLSCNSNTWVWFLFCFCCGRGPPFWNKQFCSFHFKRTVWIGSDFIPYHKRHFHFFSKSIFRSDWHCETSNHHLTFQHHLFLFYSPAAPLSYIFRGFSFDKKTVELHSPDLKTGLSLLKSYRHSVFVKHLVCLVFSSP